jgi:hypothetical protein
MAILENNNPVITEAPKLQKMSSKLYPDSQKFREHFLKDPHAAIIKGALSHI